MGKYKIIIIYNKHSKKTDLYEINIIHKAAMIN